MVTSWIERGLAPTLRLAAAQGLPITVVVGPRACGKTTLVRRLVDGGVYERYVSLVDADTRSAAAVSPRLFVETLPFGTVIDEAQLVPDLLAPIKDVVDETGRPGHFLLAGSTRVDLPTMAGTNPIAGRYARFELGPLNAAERHGRPTTNLDELLDENPAALPTADLVVERDGGFVAIAVKRAREVARDARSGIDAFRARYTARFRRWIVFYAGRNVLPLGDDIWAVPITTLWFR